GGAGQAAAFRPARAAVGGRGGVVLRRRAHRRVGDRTHPHGQCGARVRQRVPGRAGGRGAAGARALPSHGAPGRERPRGRRGGPGAGRHRAPAVGRGRPGRSAAVGGRPARLQRGGADRGVGTGGQSVGSGTGFDFATVAYDTATGARLWVARFDGPASRTDRARAVTVSPDGATVYVTG